jgi:hypothetical protein
MRKGALPKSSEAEMCWIAFRSSGIYRHRRMKYRKIWIFTAWCSVIFSILAMAQDAASSGAAPGAASQASAPPATTMRVPHRFEVPRGFHVVQVGERLVVCEPADDAWVTAAAQGVASTTRPTTMPSDILDDLKQRRGTIAADMMRDLTLTDQKPIDDFFDGRITTTLTQIQSIKPVVYYLVVTRERAADLLAAGWSDPRFHFIRFAHDLDYSTSVLISATEPMDDLAWWVEIHPGDTVATRGDALQKQIKFAEGGLTEHISLMGKNEVENLFQTFVHDQALKNLKLPHTLDWFDLGVSHIYGIKYAAELTGVSRQFWTEQLIGTPNHRGNWNRIDLINPVDPAQIRPELVELYMRALMPKGALMIQILIDRGGGDAVLAKALAALRAHTPATPGEMIKALLDATGVDLTAPAAANYDEGAAGAVSP